MPLCFYPEGDVMLSNDSEVRTMQKIVDLFSAGVPTVGTHRITEEGDPRKTEDGDRRIIE